MRRVEARLGLLDPSVRRGKNRAMIVLTSGRPDESTLFAWSERRLLFRALNDRVAIERLFELGFEEPRSLLEAVRQDGIVELDDGRFPEEREV
jgi:hypothetical protein